MKVRSAKEEDTMSEGLKINQNWYDIDKQHVLKKKEMQDQGLLRPLARRQGKEVQCFQ